MTHATDSPAKLTPPRDIEDMPVSVHFFLLPRQRQAVERKLREVQGSREEALLALLDIERS